VGDKAVTGKWPWTVYTLQ